MKKLALASLILILTQTLFALHIGDAAPAFTAVDSHGQQHSLAQYKGKFVVLEWTNQGCPYTIKHYRSGNMQNLQRQWTARGVVWLTVLSSAPGEQGYQTAAQENDYLQRANASVVSRFLCKRLG